MNSAIGKLLSNLSIIGLNIVEDLFHILVILQKLVKLLHL